MTYTEFGLYALLWLSFGAGHSLLAGNSVKRLLHPLFGRAYRLVYNLFSVMHIGLVLIGGQLWLAENSMSFELAAWLDTLIRLGRWLGLGIILAALTQYNLGLFGGLKQLRQGDSVDDDEPLHLEGMHRYVRHPIYLGVYLFLWGGALDQFGLHTALWGSVYLAIGTWFEERKLIVLYGQSYIDYRRKVPSVIPYRGRAI